MTTIYDVDTNDLIAEVAKQLKEGKLVEPPEWSPFVKTGSNRQRPPQDGDWWYVRSAAVLRTIYRMGPIGVSKLRTKYGGKKNNGMAPESTSKGSGNILRKILQQLEKSELVTQEKSNVHKGRIISAKGKSFMDKAAHTLVGADQKPKKKAAPKKKEAKPKADEEKPAEAAAE